MARTRKPENAVVPVTGMGVGELDDLRSSDTFDLPVTAAQIETRRRVCLQVAANLIRDPNAPPGDDRLPRCIAELDALTRINPTLEETGQ